MPTRHHTVVCHFLCDIYRAFLSPFYPAKQLHACIQVAAMKKPKSSYFVRTQYACYCARVCDMHATSLMIHICKWILQMWMDDNRAKYKEQNPGISLPEFTKLMGTAWKALSEQEKQVCKWGTNILMPRCLQHSSDYSNILHSKRCANLLGCRGLIIDWPLFSGLHRSGQNQKRGIPVIYPRAKGTLPTRTLHFANMLHFFRIWIW